VRNVDTKSKWSKSGHRGRAPSYKVVLQWLAFPYPVPIFATWGPNNENWANIVIELLLAGDLKVADVLLVLYFELITAGIVGDQRQLIANKTENLITLSKWRIHQVYAAFGNLAMPD
jgi:hypothetical protein